MARPFPLQPLVELAAERLDAAARRLQALDADRRAAREKLAQLDGYRQEYSGRLQQTLAAGGMGIEQVRDWQRFLARLDEALAQQSAEVARREEAWTIGQQQWLEQRRQQKAFDALATRHRASEARRELKAEQRIQDEFASRARGDAESGG